MEGFTAVLPSVVQGNLNAPLVPLGNDMSEEQAETLEKWRGLKTSDLTDGIMETRLPNSQGVPEVHHYDVPLVRPNGEPQPYVNFAYCLTTLNKNLINFISSSVAFMIERNKEAFPGFRGKDIKEKLHTYDGQQYYSVPPQFVHYIGKLLLSARLIFLFC